MIKLHSAVLSNDDNMVDYLEDLQPSPALLQADPFARASVQQPLADQAAARRPRR